MDEKKLMEGLAEELILGWEIIPTGGGFLITTDWQLPNKERIEIHVRTVGEREDLYLVTEGGELFNLFFAEGVDISKDTRGAKILNGVAENYGAKVVDYQIVKGASEGELAHAIRLIVEAVKDASYLLWHKLDQGQHVH